MSATLQQQAERLEGKISLLRELLALQGWKAFCELVEENRAEIVERILGRSLPEKPDYMLALEDERFQKGVALGLRKATEIAERALEMMQDELKMLQLQLRESQEGDE